ncbi:MAG: transposase [Chloroflexi bacterium]|nr:transposase [Chloroflexota bacterium]
MHNLPQRRSIRLQGYDYRLAGAYFVTLCTHQRECLFGDIFDGVMLSNSFGNMVASAWCWLAEHYPYVDLDTWVLMPNHLHGILVLSSADSADKPKSLGRLIGAFKTVSSKAINQVRETPAAPVWQRNFYEHVIHNESDLNRIREYILYNPARWSEDEENVSRHV